MKIPFSPPRGVSGACRGNFCILSIPGWLQDAQPDIDPCLFLIWDPGTSPSLCSPRYPRTPGPEYGAQGCCLERSKVCTAHSFPQKCVSAISSCLLLWSCMPLTTSLLQSLSSLGKVQLGASSR